MSVAMPAELEAQLRALTPTCTATRIRDIRTLFTIQHIEQPCTDPATHAMHLVCDGVHDPFPTQLMCAEHHAAIDAQQQRGPIHRCACGGTILLQMVAL